MSILQTSLTDFDFNMLQQRQPLVVQDCIAEDDLNNVLQAWFSPNITNVYNVKIDGSTPWNINNYKYCYAYALEDTELMLCPANIKSGNGEADEPICLAIKMKKSQSVIIPFKWQYGNINDIILYGIHDYVTWILDLLI